MLSCVLSLDLPSTVVAQWLAVCCMGLVGHLREWKRQVTGRYWSFKELCREMAQQLTSVAALAEDTSWSDHAHGGLPLPTVLVPGNTSPSFGLLLDACWFYMRQNSHTHKMKINPQTKESCTHWDLSG